MFRYYDDYDDYYDDYDYYDYRSEIKERHTRVSTITNCLERMMCYAIGLNRIVEFLKKKKKKGDEIAHMYYLAIEAEYYSAQAKGAGNMGDAGYKLKEDRLRSLIDVCFKWRNEHAQKVDVTPHRQMPIEPGPDATVRQRKKYRKALKKYNEKVYKYVYEEGEELDYGWQNSNMGGVLYILYFDLVGCRQISYHSNLGIDPNKIRKYSGSWDNIENSTLLKLETAIMERYGSELKKNFGISNEFAIEYESAREVLIEKFMHPCGMSVNDYADYMKKIEFDNFMSVERDTIFNYATCLGDKFLYVDLFNLLPDDKIAQFYKSMMTYYLTYKSFRSYTQMIYKPNKLSNKFFELCTDIISRAKECGFGVYRHNTLKNMIVVKTNLFTYKFTAHYSDDDLLEKFGLEEIKRIKSDSDEDSNMLRKIETELLAMYGDGCLKEFAASAAEKKQKEEEIERNRQLAEERRKEEERKRKEAERAERAKMLESFEYFTKSMLKEQWLWTDTLIKKFAGEPDMYKKNPVYSSADPMALYSKERIMEIEKNPEFVAEMKKSYKRRKIEWPYEDDVIVHGPCK